jgi:hypothetical protein
MAVRRMTMWIVAVRTMPVPAATQSSNTNTRSSDLLCAISVGVARQSIEFLGHLSAVNTRSEISSMFARSLLAGEGVDVASIGLSK